ncbi:hypothetical protein [Vibrio phage BUCT194]|uniref:Uncharacterized protein n=1 Tax=Vibrio phage BUCT194 TaxID=2859072 RepID=A0AAE8XJB3_9CAUD|nr:hypothetical protein PP741_gp025 [Vibrio phage BUCT194]UAW01200.1 hypothetical protein [Vibrio phage BUCT194]
MVLVPVLIHYGRPEDYVGFAIYRNGAYAVDWEEPLHKRGSAVGTDGWVPLKRGQEVRGITCAS